MSTLKNRPAGQHAIASERADLAGRQPSSRIAADIPVGRAEIAAFRGYFESALAKISNGGKQGSGQ